MHSLLKELDNILSEYDTRILPLNSKGKILLDDGLVDSDELGVVFDKLTNIKLEHFKRLLYLHDYAKKENVRCYGEFTFSFRMADEISHHVLDNESVDRTFYGSNYCLYVSERHKTLLRIIMEMIDTERNRDKEKNEHERIIKDYYKNKSKPPAQFNRFFCFVGFIFFLLFIIGLVS